METLLYRVVFLLVVLSSCQSFVTHYAPFTSRKSPAETITQYAIVHPAVSHAGPEHQGHPRELTVALQVNRITRFELHLTLNHKLLAPTFSTAHYDEQGEKVHETHENCFYHGTVAGHSDWMAEFSTCAGLRGSFGDLQNRHSYYHLEPLEDSLDFHQPHALYKDTEHKVEQEGTCGTPHHHSATTSQQITDHFIHELNASPKRLKRQNPNGLRVVEWLIVNDYFKYNEVFNNNRTATELRSIEIANFVDMLYSPLSIRIVLVHMITITSLANQFNSPTASRSLLDAFQVYHASSIPASIVHDSAMLMTGRDLDGNTIGIAFTGTMCAGSDSVGVTQDTGASLAGVSATAAHEVGHIFDMNHDDPPRYCDCGADQPRCIMRASISSPSPTAWSNCSIADLNSGYATMNTGVCLDNDPSVIIGTATCGNGIKEPGEICDCGPVETCNDPCCNATSCTLAGDAQCAAGPCCQNCRFRQYGTICRPDSNQCGLSEYCTGDNAECPSNVFRQDGQLCDNSTAFCFGGRCIGHDIQCKQYYGPTASTSVPECYTSNNVLGDTQGHCGASNGNFLPCSLANALCGSIQCQGGSFDSSSVTFRSTLDLVTTFVGDNECRTFTTRRNVDETSPGLVLDGTKCGTEMLCMNRQCLPVTSLSIVPCPVGSSGAVCSGNGVCNNLNQCFCNIGFTGSSCGDEVQVPTGTPAPPGSAVGLGVGLTFLFLALLGVAIVVTVVIIVVVARKSKTKSTTVTKARYSRGTSPKRQANLHGSQDDLLSGSDASPPVQNRRPPPSTPGYKPPPTTFNTRPPATTVNNSYKSSYNTEKERRAPPPPRPPPSRPNKPPQPPPSYQPTSPPPSYNPSFESNTRKPPPPPAPSKPVFVPPNQAFVPPNPKPAPKPRIVQPQPPQSSSSKPSPPSKPVVAGKPVVTPKPTAPPKPEPATKPAKLQRQWPPPAGSDDDNSITKPPPPYKKPIVPPRR